MSWPHTSCFEEWVSRSTILDLHVYEPTKTFVINFLFLYMRNTLGSICQYKEDGLVSRPPSLFTSMHQPMHGTSCLKSQLKSRPICLTAKFRSFLDHPETGKKGQNQSVLLSNIRFLWFLQSMFLLSYLYQLCGFCWQSLCRNLWPQFVYIAVLLDWKININEMALYKSPVYVCMYVCKHIGVLGTNVATISWLHWSPVSGYTVFECMKIAQNYAQVSLPLSHTIQYSKILFFLLEGTFSLETCTFKSCEKYYFS